MYQVRTEQFEGPLELLLALIEKEKLDITRISLAQVADSFIEYISAEGAVPLEQMSQFLSVASRLILLKSRALLPVLDFSDEEEESIEDLESRLKEYQRFREASLKIQALFSMNRQMYSREYFEEDYPVFAPPREIGLTHIAEAFRRILGGIVLPETIEERVMEEVITIEEKMALLEMRLVQGVESAFSDVARDATDRTHVVVSFLALLELVRRRVFHVEQEGLFGEIRFRKTETL